MFCGYHRWKVSRHLDEGKAIGRWTGAHLRGCAGCGAFHDAAVKLDAVLAGRSVRAREAEVAADLEGWSWEAVWPGWWKPAGALMGAVLIVAAGWWAWFPGPGGASMEEPERVVDRGAVRPDWEAEFREQEWQRFSPTRFPAMAEAELENEVELLWHDMQQVAGALVGEPIRKDGSIHLPWGRGLE